MPADEVGGARLAGSSAADLAAAELAHDARMVDNNEATRLQKLAEYLDDRRAWLVAAGILTLTVAVAAWALWPAEVPAPSPQTAGMESPMGVGP